jgi:hypothetical protein
MPRRLRLLQDPTAPALVALASGLVMVVAVFLPWFSTNLGEPTAPGSVSGWASTSVAKGVLAIAVIWTLAAALIVADRHDVLRIDPSTVEALGWLIAACALIAGGLAAFRLFRPPEPADFLARDFGLFLAIAVAFVGVAAGLAQASRQR